MSARLVLRLIAVAILIVGGGVYAFAHGFLSIFLMVAALVAIYLILFGVAGSENAPEAGDIPNPGGRYKHR